LEKDSALVEHIAEFLMQKKIAIKLNHVTEILESECFDELWLVCSHSLREDPAFHGIAKNATLHMIDNFDNVHISKSSRTFFQAMRPCLYDFFTRLDMSGHKGRANQVLEHFLETDALGKELAHNLLEAVFSSTLKICQCSI
jgi:hypothetical protein